MIAFRDHLPVDDVLPSLRSALSASPNAVLVAAPAAGKTTRVPLALLNEQWLAGRSIIMLEPRRLAARRAAEYMSGLLGEPVGKTVGYRIRGEARIGRETRIEIVTEGILTRMLLSDQDLPGAGLVIFDEFHERSIHADLGLALTLDLQKHLRPDLRILVMSATLDGAAVSSLLDDASVIESEGRVFPVETIQSTFAADAPLEKRIADAIVRALNNHEGDVLVFLPGIREIRRTDETLASRRLTEDVTIHRLYGDAGLRSQLQSLAPAPSGMRKVILSTSIAETSLTIDGVRIVVDSGLSRTVRFDPRRGMTGLVTVPVSRAIADQRRGRAGRQAPGFCYRIWTEADHASLPDYPTPEIKATDLAHVALDLAVWGDPYARSLRFLDPPPAAHLQQARSLLKTLGAFDDSDQLTSHGRAMAVLPIHPRLAHMIIRGKELGMGAMACDLAAILEERDWVTTPPPEIAGKSRDREVDLERRWHHWRSKNYIDRWVVARIEEQAARLRSLAGIDAYRTSGDGSGLLLGLAYPDRVARKKAGTEQYRTSGGSIAFLPRSSYLSQHEFLAIGDVDGAGNEVKILLAAPLLRVQVVQLFEGQITTSEECAWSDGGQHVVARKVEKAGSLIIDESMVVPRGERVVAAMLEGVRSLGLDALPWSKDTAAIRIRSEWLRRLGGVPIGWPDLSDERLLASIEDWLAPFLGGLWKREHLERLPMSEILLALFTHDQKRALDRLAPSRLVVPSGSSVTIDYSGAQPVLAVKLQEMFGATTTPTVAGGHVNVVLHLLSPARRPLAVTQDLPSFWKNTYPKLRTQMRAEYPKHPWPEDPLTAIPTRRTVKKRL